MLRLWKPYCEGCVLRSRAGTMFGDDYYMQSVEMGCKKGLSEYYKGNAHLAVMMGKESTWYHDKSNDPERWLKKIP